MSALKDNVLTKTVALVGAVKYDYETYAKVDKRRTEVEKKRIHRG